MSGIPVDVGRFSPMDAQNYGEHRVIIDTDLGVDDSHAVLMALLSPEIEIKGFTTVFGNASVRDCTRNVLHVLELVGRTDIPVRQGSAAAMLREKDYGHECLKLELGRAIGQRDPTAYKFQTPHGRRGLGHLEIPDPTTSIASGNAITWMIETVLDSPGEIEILALGPLTNLALATLVDPRWAASVKRIIFMGGALSVPGNVAPLSTGNIINDPEAAKIVFHSGAPIVMVGQDVTRFARLTPAHWRRMQAGTSAVTGFLADVSCYYADFYFEREPTLIDNGYPIHDMLVTAHLLKPSIFKTKKLYVTVETHGKVTRGQTVADRREYSPYEPQMEVCMEADNDALFELYIERITRLPAQTV